METTILRQDSYQEAQRYIVIKILANTNKIMHVLTSRRYSVTFSYQFNRALDSRVSDYMDKPAISYLANKKKNLQCTPPLPSLQNFRFKRFFIDDFRRFKMLYEKFHAIKITSSLTPLWSLRIDFLFFSNYICLPLNNTASSRRRQVLYLCLYIQHFFIPPSRPSRGNDFYE